MDVKLEPGTYVVAVSGGVDSMVLLDLLRQMSGVKVVVAHYDHGMRPDSDLDRQLVQEMAARWRLPFVYEAGRLGHGTSEAKARQARYNFLHRVRRASGAKAVATAHHLDDVLETVILNLLRGTGRRGLTSLRSRQYVKRPLLDVPKAQLLTYAHDHHLKWREDSTNQDVRYLRNYVRHHMLPKFSTEQRAALLGHSKKVQALHDELEAELVNHLHLQPSLSELDRQWFIMLPHAVAREVLVSWLRRHHIKDISSKMVERLIIAAKTWSPARQTDVDKQYTLQIRKDFLALSPRER